MDEPSAALDLKRKQEILPYLECLHNELAIPLISVTHSPDEMAWLADHLVLLDMGTVTASGSLFDALARLNLLAARSPMMLGIKSIPLDDRSRGYPRKFSKRSELATQAKYEVATR